MTLDNTGVENHNVYTQILDHWYYLEIISDHFTGLDHYSKKNQITLVLIIQLLTCKMRAPNQI